MALPTPLEAFSKKYLRGVFATYPARAATMGLHGYDGMVTDYGSSAIARRVSDLKVFRDELATIAPDAPPAQTWLDYEMLRLAIERELFEWETLRDWARNPMGYIAACDVSTYLKRNYAPLPTRLKAITAYLSHIPGLLAQARANLELPMPRTFAQTSLEMIHGTVLFLRGELPASLTSVEDAALMSRFSDAQAKAIAALESFAAWLRDEVLPKADDQYAIGAEAFRQMLRVGEAVELPLEKLLAVAQADLARNKAEVEATARQIAPDRSPGQVARDMTHQHPSAADLVPTAQKMMEKLRAFIVERDLVSIPYDLQPVIAETPSFLRLGFAMMDTPGAFEKVATESFYYITLPEKDWSDAQVEEWLSAFDYYSLDDTSIHEGWPGHYLHWLHFRNSPTQVAKTFETYTFSEGWAHYVEQMMIEEGYREGDPRLRLAQLAGALLRDVRFICAIGMHTQGMSMDEATHHFMQDAFMEELPARKEAERGAYDPGYLAYTLGKLMTLKLREDYRREQDSARSASLKQFHDAFLSFGAPPIPFVRKMMLRHDDGQIL
jgi:uncharacterized protein (DUF885 family)